MSLDSRLGKEGPSATLFNDGLKVVATIDNPFAPGKLALEKKDGAQGINDEVMEKALRVVHGMKKPENERLHPDLFDCDAVSKAIRKQLGDVADGIEVTRFYENKFTQ